jgi:hypothetical protein
VCGLHLHVMQLSHLKTCLTIAPTVWRTNQGDCQDCLYGLAGEQAPFVAARQLIMACTCCGDTEVEGRANADFVLPRMPLDDHSKPLESLAYSNGSNVLLAYAASHVE